MNFPPTHTIILNQAGGVATLTLHRPAQKNAIDSVMRAEVADAIARLRADAGLRALILAGAGGAFCSGGDLRDMPKGEVTTEENMARMQAVHQWLEPLLTLGCPVIAAVEGPAYGAGFGLALAADFILAAPSARFCMPFLRLGLVPDMGALYTLPRVVGLQRAKEIIYSMRVLDAEEAQRLGIVCEIHPAEALMDRAQELARAFAQASPMAMALTKRALGVSLTSDLAAMLELEAQAQTLVRSSRAHHDAIRSVLEKKPAPYQWPALQADLPR